MKIALIVNRTKDAAEEYATFIEAYLSERGAEVRCLYDIYRQEDLLGADFLITLGGDGTILRAVGILRGADIPILGINVGHLGYLTEVTEKEHIPAALDSLLSGEYCRDERTMLRAEVLRSGRVAASQLALNEVLMSRCAGISILHFGVFCDGQELQHYSADGIIVSTPTGSTAYNLSAGGPVVSPTAPVYIMTPICSHSLNGRAVILDDSSVLEIWSESPRQIVAFDGENVIPLAEGDVVRICKAQEKTTLIKIRRSSFLEVLREKMAGI